MEGYLRQIFVALKAAGYVALSDLGFSPSVVEMIANCLVRYDAAHYRQFADLGEVKALDDIGLKLCDPLAQELPGNKVGHFSAARMEGLKSD